MRKTKEEGDKLGCALKIVILITVVVLISAGCSYINKKLGWPDDNIAEEFIEGGIRSQTGIDIDLTPSTPEK